jgi:hypothetical protein
MARVQVADDVWADFRAAAGHRPLSEVLGELVTREVDRYRSRRLREGQLDPREITAALDHAAQQQADLAVIVERLERLHRVAESDAPSEPLEGPPLAGDPAGAEQHASSPPKPQPIFPTPMELRTRGADAGDGK